MNWQSAIDLKCPKCLGTQLHAALPRKTRHFGLEINLLLEKVVSRTFKCANGFSNTTGHAFAKIHIRQITRPSLISR